MTRVVVKRVGRANAEPRLMNAQNQKLAPAGVVRAYSLCIPISATIVLNFPEPR